MPDCPKCTGALEAVALDPQTAPWLCRPCARGFWDCELTDEARAIYRSQYDDWGLGAPASALLGKRTDEYLAALARGTSLRRDQLGLAQKEILADLIGRLGIHPDFLAEAQAELTRRA